jgi:hypothetical protein
MEKTKQLKTENVKPKNVKPKNVKPKNVNSEEKVIIKTNVNTDSILNDTINKDNYVNNFINFLKHTLIQFCDSQNSSNSTTNITDSKHETFIKNLLITNFKFTEVKNNKDNKFTRSMIDNPETSFLKPGEFIHQPFGTQSNPDFIIQLTKTIIIPLEAKSSKTSYKPTYNSGSVKPQYLYIFSCGINKQTTLYMGSSIITDIQEKLIKELLKKQQQLEKEYNKLLLENDIIQRGLSYYTRQMINQSGNKEKTNYFIHKDRKQCEKKVFEYLEQFI